MAELVVSTVVNAALDKVWAALTDWDTHGDWMVATIVRGTTDQHDGVGAGIEGITGIGSLVMRDTMTLSQWQPPPANPARCVVEHTGKVVRGSGAFEVEELGPDQSRVVWSEWVQLPLGLLGETGWIAVRPLAALFLRISLRRLARIVEADSVTTDAEAHST
ncbi:MAG TPA: SRPBCC family protein [Acidothermaceae bacterium]